MRLIVRFLLALMMALSAGTAYAQPPQGRDQQGFHRRDGGGRMSGEERQRLREDVQRQHVVPSRGASDLGGEERARRYAEWQRLSPEQREGVRREMRDANRSLDRRER